MGQGDDVGIANDDADGLDDNINFTLPSAGGVADLVLDKLFAFRPMGEVETEHGTAEQCYSIECFKSAQGENLFIDYGPLVIAWQQPRQELAKASDEAPWVVGRIVKKSKAYFLNPPTPPELVIARKALRLWLDERKAEKQAQEKRTAEATDKRR